MIYRVLPAALLALLIHLFLGWMWVIMAAVAGGIIFVLILHFFDTLLIAQIAGIGAIISIRFLAVKYRLGLPRFEGDEV
jgi:uncharacterized membrane protein YeiH